MVNQQCSLLLPSHSIASNGRSQWADVLSTIVNIPSSLHHLRPLRQKAMRSTASAVLRWYVGIPLSWRSCNFCETQPILVFPRTVTMQVPHPWKQAHHLVEVPELVDNHSSSLTPCHLVTHDALPSYCERGHRWGQCRQCHQGSTLETVVLINEILPAVLQNNIPCLALHLLPHRKALLQLTNWFRDSLNTLLVIQGI